MKDNARKVISTETLYLFGKTLLADFQLMKQIPPIDKCNSA